MTPKIPEPTESKEEPPAFPGWLDVVRRRVECLRFGSVQIVVHEGRVTQVESVERTRFPPRRDQAPS